MMDRNERLGFTKGKLQAEIWELYRKIKSDKAFPYDTGRLRDKAFSVYWPDAWTTALVFMGDVAPYVQYLEEGTGPHNIPRAFGRPLPFGIGGRFDGRFHPGSSKHKGFIGRYAKMCALHLARKFNAYKVEERR